MKLLKLKVGGWGPYKDNQQIDFSPIADGGLFLITGPTGAGKTTVFDAVTFALYGEVSGSVREKDSLRSDFAAADCATQVELTFLHRGEVYRILRNPRYDRAKLRGEGTTTENENAQMHRLGHCGGDNTGRNLSDGDRTAQPELMAVGSQQVTEAVNGLLGLDYRQFKQISMIAQGEFTKLLMASSKERTLIFRDIFQTRLYDGITQILGRRAHALNARLDEIKHRMDETAGAFRMESEAWEKAWNQKSRNYGKLAALVESDAEAKKAERSSLAEKQEKFEKEYKALVRKAEQARQNNRAIDLYLADLASLEQMKQALEETKARKKEHQKEEKKLPGLEKELSELRESQRSLREQYGRVEEWKRASARLTRLQEQYLLLDQQAKQKKAEFEAQDDRCRKASAGILAQGLKAGLPCPVCGSKEHPAPALLTDEIPDEKKLEQLKQAAKRQTSLANQAQAEAAGAFGALKQVEQNLENALTAEWTGGLTGELADTLLKELNSRLEQTERRSWETENAIRTIQKSCQDIQILLEKQKSAVAQKKESIKKPASMEREELADLAKQEQEQESLRKQLAKEKEKLQTILNINRSCLRQLKEHMEQRQRLEEEYGVIQKVSRAASGSNMRKLVLEQYVLSVYFDDILRAANQRLRTMTGDRYELYRLEEGKDRRMKEGMELEVLDQYTGKKRSVKTLSGGESFKAALALALGTSDVVQSYAGGIQVDTMFVDEGFGALDSESLSQAVDILASLGDSRRMIGIISHVEELKERIENQIIVEKSNNGSSIKTNFVVS